VATVLRYPLKEPVSGNYLEGSDAPTGRIDYIKIQRFRVDYTKNPTGYGGMNLPNNNVAVVLDPTVCYLAMPPSLSTSYNADFSAVGMGIAGVLSSQLVGQALQGSQSGSFNGEQIRNQLKSAAAAALPEFAFNKGAGILGDISNSLSLSNGAGSGQVLQQMTTGQVMNPFTEQVFNGVSFRNHSFNFKMFARNKSEAAQILGIITYLKIGTLPKYGEADLKGIEKALNNIIGATTQNADNSDSTDSGSATNTNSISLPEASQKGAYLQVPDRFLLEFVRLDPASDTITKLPHYKFQPCVCTSLSVNYTPDGQYVSFKDAIADLSDDATTGPKQLLVPAVEISLQFGETRILTQKDAIAGF